MFSNCKATADREFPSPLKMGGLPAGMATRSIEAASQQVGGSPQMGTGVIKTMAVTIPRREMPPAP